MIDAGKHRAVAVKGELGESKSGTPHVAVEFQLLEEGSFIFWYGYLTEKTQVRTVESLRACGWTGNDLSRDLMAEGLGSKEVELDIVHETYNGTTRPKVNWVNDPNRSHAGALEPNQKRAIAAKLKGLCMSVPGGSPAPAPQTRLSSDDIPY